MAEERAYHFNHDIWFISSAEVVMVLSIFEHLYSDQLLKSTLRRLEARKICAIYMSLPMECIEEIDREYQCTKRVELNLKMNQRVLPYKIIFKNDPQYLTPDIKKIEDKDKLRFNRYTEKDLQDQVQHLGRSNIHKFLKHHTTQTLDIERLRFEENQRKNRCPIVCMSNYIIKLWNYCALNGFSPGHSLKEDMFFGTFPSEPYEILKTQLNDHGLFEQGWKRFDRLTPTRDALDQLIVTCGENKICLPFKATNKSYELDQQAVPVFWDQVFSNIEKKDKRQIKIQHGNDLEGYSGALVQESQIIDILAIMEYLQLNKSNWSDGDRRKACAIYQQHSEVFVAQLHSEFLIKNKIELTFKNRKGQGGKLLCLSDNEIVDNCSHSPSQEVSPEEIMKVVETLKWSSYAKFLSNYDKVSISDSYIQYSICSHGQDKVNLTGVIYITEWS